MVVLLVSVNFYQITLQDLGIPSLSIMLGLVCGIILVGGLMQVLGWRLSMIHGKDTGHPRRLLLVMGLTACLSLVLLVTLAIEGLLILADSPVSSLWGFGISCCGIAILQLMSGILMLLKQQIQMGIGISIGMVVTWLLHVTWLGQFGALTTVIFGYLLISTILVGLMAKTFRKVVRQSQKQEHLFLPPKGQFLYKALPYIVYGVLSICYVVIGQLGGWFSQLPVGWTKDRAIGALNIVHMLGLISVLLTQGISESTLNNFWPFINNAQQRLRFNHQSEINSEARYFIKSHLKKLLVMQVIISTTLGLAIFCIWEVAGLNQSLGQLLPNLLVLSLISYGLLAWGLYICGLLITVIHTWSAVRAFFASIVAEISGSLLLGFWFGFEASILGMILGGVCLVLLTQRWLNRLLKTTDYMLYQAF